MDHIKENNALFRVFKVQCIYVGGFTFVKNYFAKRECALVIHMSFCWTFSRIFWLVSFHNILKPLNIIFYRLFLELKFKEKIPQF